MPNCFQLTKKGSDKPAMFSDIDVEICGLLNQPVDEVHYCKIHPELPSMYNWYEVIGLRLAMGVPLTGATEDGRSFDKMWENVSEVEKPVMDNVKKVVEFLRENYTADAWATIGNAR